MSPSESLSGSAFIQSSTADIDCDSDPDTAWYRLSIPCKNSRWRRQRQPAVNYRAFAFFIGRLASCDARGMSSTRGVSLWRSFLINKKRPPKNSNARPRTTIMSISIAHPFPILISYRWLKNGSGLNSIQSAQACIRKKRRH
jgi:hypothetical protein